MSLPVSFAQAIWIRRTIGFAGFTCIVYDYFLTLHEEVEYIWKAPWTATKVVFLINRYGNLLGQVFTQIEDTGLVAHNSKEFCQGFNLFSTLFTLLSSESIHILVLLRAWAIWGCQRRAAAALISIYVFYLFLMLGMTGFGVNTPNFRTFQYLDIVGICIGIMPPYIWTAFVGSFFLDTVVFMITMRSLRQYSRESRCLYPSALFRHLVRHAVMFYLVSVVYNWFTVIACPDLAADAIYTSRTVYASDPRYILTMSFTLPILSIAGQRLVLSLRGLTVRSYSPRSLSAEVDRQLQAFDDAMPQWWQMEDASKQERSGTGRSSQGLQVGPTVMDSEMGSTGQIQGEAAVGGESIELEDVRGLRSEVVTGDFDFPTDVRARDCLPRKLSV